MHYFLHSLNHTSIFRGALYSVTWWLVDILQISRAIKKPRQKTRLFNKFFSKTYLASVAGAAGAAAAGAV